MFTAGSREAVEAFHEAALKAGGRDSGGPGYQGPEEMGYYAALVFDPDGNTLEAGFRERKKISGPVKGQARRLRLSRRLTSRSPIHWMPQTMMMRMITTAIMICVSKR